MNLITISFLIPIIMLVGYNSNYLIDFVHAEEAIDRPELLQLFNEGYTEVCLDDYFLGKKLSDCVFNPDYYEFKITETAWSINNTDDTHCAYYINVVKNSDNKIEFGCPFSWGNDWNNIQWGFEFVEIEGFENDFYHITTNYDASKIRLSIPDRNPDTMKWK